MDFKLLGEIIRFGVVGTCAAFVHMLVLFLVVHFDRINPLLANVVAFLVAFNVSYFGHRFITFRKKTLNLPKSMTKCFGVAVGGFVLNESLFYLFYQIFALPYLLAIFIVLLIVPMFTFLFSKYFVYV